MYEEEHLLQNLAIRLSTIFINVTAFLSLFCIYENSKLHPSVDACVSIKKYNRLREQLNCRRRYLFSMRWFQKCEHLGESLTVPCTLLKRLNEQSVLRIAEIED